MERGEKKRAAPVLIICDNAHDNLDDVIDNDEYAFTEAVRFWH